MKQTYFFIGVYFVSLTSGCRGFLDSFYEKHFPEGCTDFWIPNNVTGLRAILNQKLYGQHLALKAVTNHINGHIRKQEPQRALALSFHGYTGTGKNYVCRFIAEHLYREGMKSKFVHEITSTLEFPHEGNIARYKDRLKSLIEGSVTKCPQSLFIFDEVDKMPPTLLDTLKPYLDFKNNIGGVVYRKAIFIFLSNSGGTDITKYVLQQWRNGLPREEIKFSDIEKAITNSALNSESKAGLWQTELIIHHMMASFIPFLPLTKQHVAECIKDSLLTNEYYNDVGDVSKEVIQEVIDELPFYPEKEQVFSAGGCKRVEEKVHFVMG